MIVTDSGPVVAAVRTWRWWDVLRLALVLLWLVAAVGSWWTAPRQESYEQARADVAAGRATAYRWGDEWETDTLRRWMPVETLRSSGPLGPLFAWRTPDGRVHWTDTDDYHNVTITTDADQESHSGAGAARIAQDLQAAGLEHRGGDVNVIGRGLSVVGGILAVVFLGVLVTGPAPTRGTRWFWFWVAYFLPYGLGLLAWLARERPWSLAAPTVTASDGVDRRDRGIRGFTLGILGSLLIGVVSMTLQAVLRPW